MRQIIKAAAAVAAMFLSVAQALTLPPAADEHALGLRANTPSYCNVPYNGGSGTSGALYAPKCGRSYFGQTVYSSYTAAATDYLNCLSVCDNDSGCVMFSFNKAVPSGSNGNCLLIDQQSWTGVEAPYVNDSNFDSGDYDIADTCC